MSNESHNNPSNVEADRITPNSAVQPVLLAPPPSNVEADQNTPNSAVQPVPLLPPPEEPSIPIFEVAFRNGMWWSMPAELSMLLFQKYNAGENAGYTWDWGESRSGSWKPADEETSINRYVVDFEAMEQRNIDNDRRRSLRLVWLRRQDVTPLWTGQKPRTEPA